MHQGKYAVSRLTQMGHSACTVRDIHPGPFARSGPENDVARRVRELTAGVGVCVVFDSVGRSTFASSLDSLKRRGRMVCVGTASGSRLSTRSYWP